DPTAQPRVCNFGEREVYHCGKKRPRPHSYLCSCFRLRATKLDQFHSDPELLSPIAFAGHGSATAEECHQRFRHWPTSSPAESLWPTAPEGPAARCDIALRNAPRGFRVA